jgi:hypothetical protein
VAIALACSSLIHAPLQQYFANRLIGLTPGRYLAGLAVPAGATAALAIALVVWRFTALSHGAPAWLVLLGAVPLGALSYAFALSALGFDWPSLARQVVGRPKLAG